MTTDIIDQVKSFFESDTGAEWLLTTISGARHKENLKRYYTYEEPTYNREKEQDKKLEARKTELSTPKIISFKKSDVLEMVQFNQEHTDQIMYPVITETGQGAIIHHHKGQRFPCLPIIQEPYWQYIIPTGEGIAVDNKGQHWQVVLVE